MVTACAFQSKSGLVPSATPARRSLRQCSLDLHMPPRLLYDWQEDCRWRRMPRHRVARAVVCSSCAIPRAIMPVRRDLEESVHMNRKPRLHGERKKAIAAPFLPTRSQDAVGDTGPQPLIFSAVRKLQRPATPPSSLQMSPVSLCVLLLGASARGRCRNRNGRQCLHPCRSALKTEAQAESRRPLDRELQAFGVGY